MTVGELHSHVTELNEQNVKMVSLVMTVDKTNIDLIIPLSAAGAYINSCHLIEVIEETERAGLVDVLVDIQVRRVLYGLLRFAKEGLGADIELDGNPVIAHEQTQ